MILDQQFDWNGRTVAWTAWGQGPAVVFCHGTPWSSRVWAPFAAALSAEFTVYLWDMPGYGQSSKQPEHAVDLGMQGRLFADLLADWELEAPHVIAHDYGGAVSLRTHLLHGSSYASLCLVDVVALRPWGSPFFTLVKENAEVFSQLPPAIHRGVVEAYIAGASYRGLRQDQLAELVGPWLDAEGQAAFYRQIAQAGEKFTAELEPLLASIGVPLHIVWGREDSWIPMDRGQRLHRAVPGSSLSLIEGAGHLIQFDAPAELAVELHTWLQRAADDRRLNGPGRLPRG